MRAFQEESQTARFATQGTDQHTEARELVHAQLAMPRGIRDCPKIPSMTAAAAVSHLLYCEGPRQFSQSRQHNFPNC